MAGEYIDTLKELVHSICDRLYTERSLITKQAVIKEVLLHENWLADAAFLDQQIPLYINAWRLDNLQSGCDLAHVQDNEQSEHYKAELAQAQQTILNLQNELLVKNQEIKLLRANIIQGLRGMLDV